MVTFFASVIGDPAVPVGSYTQTVLKNLGLTAAVMKNVVSEEEDVKTVVAKVARDRFMVSMDVRYPGYGFASHKGYTCQEHREAIFALGASPLHRRSFGILGGRSTLLTGHHGPDSSGEVGAQGRRPPCRRNERG